MEIPMECLLYNENTYGMSFISWSYLWDVFYIMEIRMKCLLYHGNFLWDVFYIMEISYGTSFISWKYLWYVFYIMEFPCYCTVLYVSCYFWGILVPWWNCRCKENFNSLFLNDHAYSVFSFREKRKKVYNTSTT